MIEIIQASLDNYFFEKEPKIPVAYNQLKPTSTQLTVNEYITFSILNDIPTEYADNKEIVGDTNVIVNYFTTDRSTMTSRKKEIKDAMELANFITIDKGSDIPADNNADLFGISLEFRYSTIVNNLVGSA